MTLMPRDVMSAPTHWAAYGFGYAWPQDPLVDVPAGLEWTPNPTPAQAAQEAAFYGVALSDLVGDHTYLVVLNATVPSTLRWRAAVGHQWSSPSLVGTGDTQSIVGYWRADSETAIFGIEVEPLVAGDWGSVGGPVLIQNIRVQDAFLPRASTTLSVEPMTTQVSMNPDYELDNPHYTVTVRWLWPKNWGSQWSKFRLVRRIGSPAAVPEEGITVLETYPDRWPDPSFEDANPPPNKWVYYTAFVLLPADKIWVRVGEVSELGVGDHNWTINMPELLPGVSVSRAQQVVAKADRDHQLVEFLQPPAMFLDRVMSLGESVQHFWDPRQVPPRLLPGLLETLGLSYDDTLSDARLRDVVQTAMRHKQHGTLEAVRALAEAAAGVEVTVRMSDNHMLNVLDSSFEWKAEASVRPPAFTYAELLAVSAQYADVQTLYPSYGAITTKVAGRDALARSAWEPKDPDHLQVRRFFDYPQPPNTLSVEVLDDFFLHIEGPMTLTNGVPPKTGGGGHTVPVSTWSEARGGLFARSSAVTDLILGLNLYDAYGNFLRNVTLIPTTRLTTDWTWYTTKFDAPIPLNQSVDSDVLHDPQPWVADQWGLAQPQNAPVVLPSGVRFTWNSNPDPGGDIYRQPVLGAFAKEVAVSGGGAVSFSMVMGPNTLLSPGTAATPWRLVVFWDDGAGGYSKAYSGWRTTDATQPSYDSMAWTPPPGVAIAWFGFEAQAPPKTFAGSYQTLLGTNANYGALPPKYSKYEDFYSDWWSGGWTTRTQHFVEQMQVLRGEEGHAYWAAPVITVTDSADIDLICVDDG